MNSTPDIADQLVSNNPELKETLADQLEGEQKGDYWHTLTDQQKQELMQSLREVDEGIIHSHEQVKQEIQAGS